MKFEENIVITARDFYLNYLRQRLFIWGEEGITEEEKHVLDLDAKKEKKA